MTDIDGTETESQDEGTAASDEQEQGKTFTQDELDKIVSDRLARQSKKFADYDDLRSFKANAEKERKSQMSETELKIEQARTEAANEVKQGYATQLAAAQLTAALTGLVEDPQSVIEDLNLSKFINEDLTVDTEAVNSLRQKYENLVSNKRKNPLANLDHGRTNGQVKGGNVVDDFATFMGNL